MFVESQRKIKEQRGNVKERAVMEFFHVNKIRKVIYIHTQVDSREKNVKCFVFLEGYT